MTDIINFAHRGAAGHCPENTMISFVKALEFGATGIETDVQMTKDGQLVLIHDEALQRTTGSSQWVKDVTLDEMKALDAGSWFHENFAGERIPTLGELLDLVRDKETIVNLELKNGVVLYPELESRVIEMVRKYELSDRVIISSFNHYSLVECKKIAPEIRTGVLYMEGIYEPWNYAKHIGADALHAFKYAVRPELVSAASEQGVPYHPFTVNEQQEMRVLIAAGVAGIITDYPDRLAELLSNEGV